MVTGHDRQLERAAERAQAVGLFRYCLVRPLVAEGLTGRQRGVLVRELAEAEHTGPFGDRVRVSRPTIDRWVRRWRAGGFEALVPPARRVAAYTPAAVLEVAVALKRELPERTAAQIAAILTETSGWSPNERTLQRHFVRLELNTRPDGKPPAAFGRFQAGAPNDLWTGDGLHGPVVEGRKAILFAFIDDHCAPRSAPPYPRQSREKPEGRFLGLMAYLDPKGEGDNSMPGKQQSCSGVEARC
ncbi:MAG TPA: helix-turn-helix domain-containing protein [Pseudonocardiaceae bacterium]|nr:helix-turn-helix domain-containing protein [Pseudonocardiaceae bacterium]